MNTPPRFQDIPQFPQAYYAVDVPITFLESSLKQFDNPDHGSPLILNPEWQRGHVWSQQQQIAFMEYFLKGGSTGTQIYLNCSSWKKGVNTPVYCLDGLQRLTAARAFVDDKIPAFGHLFSEYEDRPRITQCRFRFNMLNLQFKRELLAVYLDFNSGGTPHNPKELKRVSDLLAAAGEDEPI